MYLQCISLIKLIMFLLQEELDQLLKAAVDGNVSDLHYLIQVKKYSVDTRGPSDNDYVS